MERSHQHHDLEINYFTGGRLTLLLGGRVMALESGRMLLFWAATPHQVIAVEGHPYFFWFTLPMAWVSQWSLPASGWQRLLEGHLFQDESRLMADKATCDRWLTDLGAGPAAHSEAALLEMEALVRRLVTAKDGAPLKHPEVAVGNHRPVERMAAYIASHYTRPLKVEDVAAQSGLHPNYAMNLFRKTCGSTIMDYVVKHRLFHAKRLLATTDLKILDIALESGFGSASRFYEAFKSDTGISPKAFRTLLPEP